MTETNHRRTVKKNPTRRMEMQKHAQNKARCDDQARSEWKRLTSRSARRKDRLYEEQKEDKTRKGAGFARMPKNRK